MLLALGKDHDVLRQHDVARRSLPVQLFAHQFVQPTVRRLSGQRHGQVVDAEHAQGQVGQLGGECRT